MKGKTMTYEEKIAQFSGYDVIIRTDVDLRNADMLNSMHTVANRLRMILSAVELHADYEDLLAIKDILYLDLFFGNYQKLFLMI